MDVKKTKKSMSKTCWHDESSDLSGREEVIEPKSSKLGCEAKLLGKENCSGARR